MKRRNRMGRHRSVAPRRKALGLLAGRGRRKRKSWTFERLEDRFCFSVGQLPPGAVVTSYGNDTADGALMTWFQELQWSALQEANATGTAPAKYAILALPSDPMFVNQWHLLNTGQEVGNPDLQHLFGQAGEDINVVPVWNQGYTGNGVLVAVLDTGVQLFHPDLAGNISPTLRFDAVNGTSNVSPSLFDPEGFHGTSVAGIIGMVADNGEGGSGVAPGVTLVPIKILDQGFSQQTVLNAFQWALQHNIDITNNSWLLLGQNGDLGREAIPLDPAIIQVLRNSVVSGRDGLGMIHVFASGNNAGPFFTSTFGGIGNYDSSSYSALLNSRYVIGVTGVDHDGLYINADGTFTTYPMAGASVLVAAPTGSNGAAISIGSDDGFGSGIWTTDLVGDFGLNVAPLPSGFDPDVDPWPDPDYTSRFNGTSASAPMVSGVIALMLEANPNLTYRDVQEILVRSARQNAQFESPSSGGLSGAFASQNTWIVNQIEPWREVDSFFNPLFIGPITGFFDPIADPNTDGFAFTGAGAAFYAPDTNDGNRQYFSQYEPQPPMFTNGAGYTVSQGYGVYSEQIGYGHGVIDAELAVKMALQWDALGQNIEPGSEHTFTTGIINQGPNTGWAIAPGVKGSPPPNGISFVVPGGLASAGGDYIAYYNEFFVDMPFDNYMGPLAGARGLSYFDFAVPPSQSTDVEWVEVRLEFDGPAEDLDFMRIFLTSPEGTQSELNHFYGDPNLFSGTYSRQPTASPPGFIDPAGSINNTGDAFLWTFSSNRHWGETSNSEVIIHPATGEPVLQDTITFDPVTQQFVQSTEPIFRNWELHIENWSNSEYSLPIIEFVWHGKQISDGTYDPNYAVNGIQSAQRVQGFVGIDTNGNEKFNYSRYVQTLNGQHSDAATIRTQDIQRQLDFDDVNLNGVLDYDQNLNPVETVNQEPFAENIVVQARRVFNGIAETNPVAQFLTGADGNYYFDLNVQADMAFAASIGATLEYEISTIDPENRAKLEDVDTPALTTSDPQFTYLPHYKQTWRINPDWFYAPDRDNPLLLGNDPGEIFFDPITKAPEPFTNFGMMDRVPMPVKNINFLLKQDAPLQQFNVEGNVYADLNGNGQFDGDDAAVPGVFVYQDVNRNGISDAGEQRVLTDANGHYVLTIPADHLDTYAVGVVPPTNEWLFTDPGQDGVENVFAGPGSPTQIVNFFLNPPDSAFPPNGVGPGSIAGVLYNDLDGDGVRDPDEGGVANFRVFIDLNENGIWDSATEASTITGINGSYLFSDVTPGLYRIDVVIPNEGTPAAAWSIISPALGYRVVDLGAGGSVTGVNFGLDNRADSDWGDLPNTYQTTSAANGPRHTVVPGFQLGASVDGEVDGIPTPVATGEGQVGDNDDGVVVVGNGGVLKKGVNTLQVTVAGVGGLLTGWMDFNADGQFSESERLSWTLNGTNLGGEADLNPGTYNLQITIPASAVDGALATRLRWGEQGLSFTGAAQVGEVEDYFFGLNFLFGDYNKNGVVDNADYVVWRRTQGQIVAPFTGADGNGNGIVDAADFDVWRAHFGEMIPPPGAGAILADVEQPASSGSSAGTSTGAVVFDAGSGGASVGYTTLGPSAHVPSTTMPVDTVVVGMPTSTSEGLTRREQLFPIFTADGNVSSAFRSSVDTRFVRSAAADTASADSGLLLLDLAWADMDEASYDATDDSLCEGGQHEEVHASDLALAAVLNEENDWWDSI